MQEGQTDQGKIGGTARRDRAKKIKKTLKNQSKTHPRAVIGYYEKEQNAP